MRTDTMLIESYLGGNLPEEEVRALLARKKAEPGFRQRIFLQAQVQLAALITGRRKREAQILDASIQAFSDPHFNETIRAIFR